MSSTQYQGAGAFQVNIKDDKQPKIFNHNILNTTKYEKDNIDQVLDVLQKFYDDEKRRQKMKESERDEKILRQE